jgi:hypothetical protein
MKRAACILAMLLLTAACRHHPATSGEGYDEAVRIAREWFACDHRDDNSCAAALLHIPPDYAGQALKRERRSVVNGVKIIRERFGYIRALGPPVTAPGIVALTWAAGTQEYWVRYPETAIATFPVTYSKLSDGYLQAEVCRIGSGWQLKAIRYGLPVSNPSSAPMIEMTNRELGKAATSPSE